MAFRTGVNLLLMTILSGTVCWSQPLNDACNNAQLLCPNVPLSGSNENATATVCPDCEDDFTFCFSGDNTVWYTFTTNDTGGDVTIDIFNLTFISSAGQGTQLQAVIVTAIVPCDAATFSTAGNCEAGSAVDFTLTATGLPANTTYYVIINGAMNGGATAPAEATFDIAAQGTGFDRPPAGLSITGPPGTVCPEEALTFQANLVNCEDTSSFSWYINGILSGTTIEPIWQTSEIRDGDIVSLNCSCFVDCPEDLTAQFGPVPVANLTVNAGPDVVLSPRETTLLSGSTNGTSWFWTPAENLSNPTGLQTVASPETTTTYFLTANGMGCTLSDEVVVTITENMVIPGSFSPNGDGVNDRWIIEGLEDYPDAQVTIYDRWGQELIDIVGYSLVKAWDGINHGKPVTDGVYYYIVNLRDGGNSEPRKGFVTVIR